MSDNIIELVDVSKYYHDTSVLHHINLHVKNGEFLTLLGPSGCGKTTLLRLISGFEEPSSGKIYIGGQDMEGIPPNHRYVNTVFQSYALFPHMTVFDNVAFGLQCKGTDPTEITDRVHEALKMVKLDAYVHRKPAQLSGGQQQRVAIARAVVNKPLVLLLDEPLSSLDYRLRKNMQLELKQLQTALGITFIFVTHDQEEALSMSDRIVVLSEGLIAQIGTPREVYEEPADLAVATFVGEANIFETELIEADEKFLDVIINGKAFKFKNRKGFKTGDKIITLVRPEDLQVWSLSEVQDPTNMFPATVEQVTYKGVTVDLQLRMHNGKRVAATQFFNEDDEKLDFVAGEAVWIEWLPGWETILSAGED
ncbi:MAG: potA [Gammaproteobacteria bacterium]|jgi:spermidine/putrescine transport system ATP-binding protein|nr:potA [Gammaproteobacteria bacterium]